MASGLVIKNTGNIYDVLDSEGEVWQCKVRGSFRLKGLRTTNPVAVGDRVEFDVAHVACRKHAAASDSEKPFGGEKPFDSRKPSDNGKPFGSGKSFDSGDPSDSEKPFGGEKPFDSRKPSDSGKPFSSEKSFDSGVSAAGQESYCWITAVAPRKNCLLRKSVNLSKQMHIIATNIDIAVVVASVAEPRTPRGFIDRTLISCEAYNVPAIVVFNKIDLEAAAPTEVYETAGYTVLSTSIKTRQGVNELKKIVSGKTVLFTGNSGVGKSALINAIDPTFNLKTGEISTFNEKGKHTTTFAQMFQLKTDIPGEKTFLIDTPGIKEFGMLKINTEELSQYFPEMVRIREQCAYSNCTHTHEPRCAVKAAVEAYVLRSETALPYACSLQKTSQKSPQEPLQESSQSPSQSVPPVWAIHPARYQSYLNILSGDEIPDPSLLENKNEYK